MAPSQLVLAAILAIVMLGTVGAWFSRKRSDSPKTTTVETAKQQVNRSAPLDRAVLTIIGMDRKGSPVSQGSGFILSADGLAGSNYHVLRAATHAVAECCGGRKFEIVSVEGADLSKDLVVFQLSEVSHTQKPDRLPYVEVASSTEMTVGERLIAVGSPQGLENTVSDGILSAVREYEGVRYLQITAPISPGSSGGPVLNTKGQLVGVATFQFTEGQNLNFAVAAEHVRPLLDQRFGTPFAQFQGLVQRAQAERNAPGQPATVGRSAAAESKTKHGNRQPATTLDETLQWLSGALGTEANYVDARRSLEVINADSCVVAINEVNKDDSEELLSRDWFSLADIDPEGIEILPSATRFRIHTTNYIDEIVHTERKLSLDKTGAPWRDRMGRWAAERTQTRKSVYEGNMEMDLAPRFIKALKRAVELCGGKQSTF